MPFKVPRGLALAIIVAFIPALCAGVSAKGSTPLRGRLARLLNPFEVSEERLNVAFAENQEEQEVLPQPTVELKLKQGLIDTDIELEDVYQAPSLPRALRQVVTSSPEPASAPMVEGSYGGYGDQDKGSYGDSQDAGYSGSSRRLMVAQPTEGEDAGSGYGGYGDYGSGSARHLMEYASAHDGYGARRQLMEGEAGGYGYGEYDG